MANKDNFYGMSAELPLYCPFCGKNRIFITFAIPANGGSTMYSYECDNCGVRTKDYPSPEEALAFWNRRVKPTLSGKRKVDPTRKSCGKCKYSELLPSHSRRKNAARYVKCTNNCTNIDSRAPYQAACKHFVWRENHDSV